MRAWISDFDGTLRLYGENGPYYRDEDLKAVTEFQKAGGLFGICSGRSLTALLAVLPEKLKPDFCIVTSGAAIVKMGETPEFLLEKTIDPRIVKDMYCRFENSGKIYIQTADRMYTFHAYGEALPKEIQTVLHDPEELMDLKILGVSIGTAGTEEASVTAAAINREFGTWVRAYQNIDYLDIIRNDCSKGTGVREARRIFSLTHLYGIGDSYNDIPLLETADTAFTFAISPPEVQAYADYVVNNTAEAIAIAAGEKQCSF